MTGGIPAKHRHVAMELVHAALAAVDPDAAVRRALTVRGRTLCVAGLEEELDLDSVQRLVVIGAGKASLPMVRAAEAILGDDITGGLAITKTGHLQQPPQELPRRVVMAEASHPLPDERGVQNTARLVRRLDGLKEQDLVICLISGGGSALMTLPVPGVELSHLEELNGLLLAAGAPIEEINAVRKHVSRVKGGRLAAMAAPARVVSLILSDVVGNPLDVIASGPTAPDSTSFADALEVLRRYDLLERAPGPVVEHLRSGAAGQVPDTPGADREAIWARVHNCIIGSNEQAAEAAARRAEELGLRSLVLSTFVQGEAREVARVHAAVLKELALRGGPLPRPACLIAGGETTVTIRGPGKGGRNQELALAAALDLAGLPDVLLVALATDGGDGPTDAGGAMVDGTTVARGAAMGRSARDHLERNDAYPYFAALGDLLMLGPTGTNVNDLTLLLAFAPVTK